MRQLTSRRALHLPQDSDHDEGDLPRRDVRALEAHLDLTTELHVAPGRREVKVQVSWEDGVRTGSAWANFKAGATLRLKARLGSFGGIKKDLSLDWD